MGRAAGVRGRTALVVVVVLAALAALGPGAGSAGAVRYTFIGDSKAAGIEYSAEAKRILARGHIVRRDLKVCRRLVAPSCSYQGVTPLTALAAIRRYGQTLGTVLVIDVGYNDSSATYRRQLVRVVQAARARGVRAIVWVNLRAVRSDYRRINAIIQQEYNRRPIMYLANWNTYTRGRPSTWFGSDGIHLTGAGAVGLARLVRQYVRRAASGPREVSGLAAAPGDDPAAEEEPVPAPAADPETTTGEEDDEQAALTGNSPPVGPNLGGSDGGSGNLGGFLVFAGGAALMVLFVVVTVKRRKTA